MFLSVLGNNFRNFLLCSYLCETELRQWKQDRQCTYILPNIEARSPNNFCFGKAI